jgi:hypothetical protein
LVSEPSARDIDASAEHRSPSEEGEGSGDVIEALQEVNTTKEEVRP